MERVIQERKQIRTLKLNGEQVLKARYNTLVELNGQAFQVDSGVNPKKRSYKEAGFGEPEDSD